MESISTFQIFKIGVGPSSSHTLGPWKISKDFINHLSKKSFTQVKVHLYGSLSKTGKGHATNIAVVLGLSNLDIENIETYTIEETISNLKENNYITIHGLQINFDFAVDILFHQSSLPYHPNCMTLQALDNGKVVLEKTYASIGGGFIEEVGGEKVKEKQMKMPYPINTGKDLLEYTSIKECRVADIVYMNEQSILPKDKIHQNLQNIFKVMIDSVYRGCHTQGILPGGLNVTKRAKNIHDDLMSSNTASESITWVQAIQSKEWDHLEINKWISCFALAVNEENASMGKVVTSPTNGAAGVIPSVLLYYFCFCTKEPFDFKSKTTHEIIQNFLFTSGEIGCLFKKGATISAAVGGCQAEIGVSSSMAAAGLTALFGGSPEQVLMAAEIAMEHHLGLTCDPIGGLVQIPCIERNVMGVAKAIAASNLALSSDPQKAIVHIDTVIATMWQTAQDMKSQYKETSEGGLATKITVDNPSC